MVSDSIKKKNCTEYKYIIVWTVVFIRKEKEQSFKDNKRTIIQRD